MWMEMSHRNSKKKSDLRLKQIVDIPHSLVINSLFRSQSSSPSLGLLISPGLFAYSVLLIYTQSLVSVCVFGVCFFLGPQSECLRVWVHLSLWMYIFLSYFPGCETGRWARPCPMVTFFNNVYSASRDSSHWNCWESRPSMRCTPPMLCSAPLRGRWDAAIPL